MIESAERHDMTKRLERWCASADGLDVEIDVQTGNTALTLIGQVLAVDHDLVVVTSDEDSEDRATIKRLLRKCPCPVWVIRPTRARIQRVLVAVNPEPDEIELNRTLLELAAGMVELYGGELHVVHAWSLYGEATLRDSSFASSPPDRVEEFLRSERDIHQRALDELLACSKVSDAPWQVHLTKGVTRHGGARVGAPRSDQPARDGHSRPNRHQRPRHGKHRRTGPRRGPLLGDFRQATGLQVATRTQVMNDRQSRRPGRPVLTFLGGVGTVTGSRFLVETAESTVLVDCGLFQGLKELRLRNWERFPVDPAGIDAVVITHAHIDHIGYLPRLRKLGFGGHAMCTHGTTDLAEIVLPDSGHLQEEEAGYANRMGYSKHRPALPLYTEADAHAAAERLRPVDYEQPITVTSDITATFRPAGHILGSATIKLDLTASGRSVLFSGDLGRPTHPLLEPPCAPDGADVIVMESTYGGRRHDDTMDVEQFADVITRTAKRGGTILIPAFAVDRTEVVLYRLRELMTSGMVPELPVYVDSPMALRALHVYRKAIANGAADIRPELHAQPDPFDTGQLHEVKDVEDSKALASAPHPSIIVSASGMATGGRVLHHLARLLPDGRNAVVLVGFQAAGTRGRSLAEGASEIKMFGSYVRVRAEVANLRSFSIHADHGELIDWYRSASVPPDMTYLVHGEPVGAALLHDAIGAEHDRAVAVPAHLERVRLD